MIDLNVQGITGLNMKKLIAVLIATLATTQAFAQEGSSSALATSVRTKRSSGLAIMPAITLGGTQFTSLSQFGNQAKAETGMSYTIGALGELGRGTFVFQSGLLYTQQNAAATVDWTYLQGSTLTRINSKTKVSASYIGIPLAMKARTRVAEGVRLIGRIGVMPAFFLNQKTEMTGTVTSNGMNEMPINQSESGKSGVRGFNAFGFVGAGPEFAIARNQNVRVELGYERMLLSAAEKSDVNQNPNWAFHSLNLMLSYAVGI